MPKPRIIYDLGCDGAVVQCPECEVAGQIGADQVRGDVSIKCECGYHETHDLTPKALHAD
jgi:hypothetical protein